MGKCSNCGHGRQWHRQSQNAISKRRSRGLRPSGHLSCWFKFAVTTSGARRNGGWLFEKCPCRRFR